ncbi:MAG TPA: biotin carboxylase N-terminal domain-containing protein [Jatrophihabitantaceae bacterium]
MITSVLVANRGEIARRVFRTCRAMGVTTVAVFSDADASAPHVVEADAAVHLPGNAPADTYLRADLIVAAAQRAGADAVHPGYGFLSENAAFARAVIEAGLTWVGPPPEAIESMGRKVEAKKLMAAAGVPVLDEVDPDSVTEAHLPVLIKASAGGGGRGMRIVRTLSDLPVQLDSARSEAASAFGDPTVFCEPYLEAGRHIEVQVMADQYGTVWTVGERECSIQRRHQKVLEEAPSPLVERTPGLRGQLFDAARAAATAIGYVGAGTVEFIVGAESRFFFLETNTRLQVEHPVTECTTGLDLVHLQLQIADGARLPAAPPDTDGHAIEVRLYAEDPARDWQPQSGIVHRFDVSGEGIRVDSGVVDGSLISPFYDPMLAKVISWAPTRDEAAAALAGALTRARIHGPTTNRDLLVNVLRHPAFRAGDTDTGFLDRPRLREPARTDRDLAALAAALADAATRRTGFPSGWRNVPSQPQRKQYEGVDVEYRLTRDGLVSDAHPDVRLVEATPNTVVLDIGGVRRRYEVAAYPDLVCVDEPRGTVTLRPIERFPDPAAEVAAGSLLAPMPGTVVRVAVSAGDQVGQGQPLLWLEAMKMEHTITAPAAGVVTELPVRAGQPVDVGTVLAIVQPSAASDGPELHDREGEQG